MRLTSSRAYTRAAPLPKMPPGLVELMEGLTKDVLRNNPSNVYEFCANHLEKLLELRDGPLPAKALSLNDKIAIAQEKVRQRAKERQQLFDSQAQNDFKPSDPEQSVSNTELNANKQELTHNLRAPVHHDQELSLSSEVEISHEPTDNNSLTSKDSNFDDSDDIPISKSSTFSSISKSTVIDLISSNDQETNDKDDGVENTETVKTEIQQTESEIASETVENHEDIISKDQFSDLPTIDINYGDPAQEEEEVLEDQKDDKNIESSSDKSDLLKVSSEFLGTRTVIEESDPIHVPVEKNLAKQVDDIMEQLPNIPVESNNEIELKSLDEVNAIIEEDENTVNQIEPSQDSGNGTDHSVEASSTEVENSVDVTVDNTPHNSPNTTTVNVDLEKSENLSSTEDKHIVIDTTTSEENIIEDSVPDKNSEQTENKIDSMDASIVIVDNQETIDTSKPEIKKESNVDPECVSDKTPNVIIKDNTTGENSPAILAKDDVNVMTIHDQDDGIALEETHGDMLHASNEENENKEDNASSSSTSFQRLGSVDNNDDSSVMESDLSKTEDDIMPKSDNENGQNNMDLETAAETIQKVFRSFLFKSRNSTFEDITNDDATSMEDDNIKSKAEYYAAANASKERRPLGITRMDTVLQTVNEEKSLSLSTDDSSTLSSAATTIQAHVRGFLVRNRLNSYKTVSTNSMVNSNEMLDTDNEQQKNKTVLNIHIVPEEGNYLSRDESLITSMDLSLDESPPSSINLHPLSYDLVSERRKLLKREDAIQSVSPPSNNSGKLSEDSVKEILLNENDALKADSSVNEKSQLNPENNSSDTMVTDVAAGVVQNASNEQETETAAERLKRSLSPDESDVVTPFPASPRSLVDGFENTSKLIHSGEFHDVVLPTKVSRSDTTVVREFKNVLVYILLWNN